LPVRFTQLDAQTYLGRLKIRFHHFLNDLQNRRVGILIPINQPLILISQIQRSGGTLLSQLFDDHPEVHAHPHELYWGRPMRWRWPELDLRHGKAESYFIDLFEKPLLELTLNGYRKFGAGAVKPQRFPFCFNLSKQKLIFEAIMTQHPPKAQRDVLNAYLTAYFNAWVDYQNLYREPKRFITAFVPRLNMDADSVERFFYDYRDGFLICIQRNPVDWYASAKAHFTSEYHDLSYALGLWQKSVEASVNLLQKYKKRVILIQFESLVENTEAVMRSLCEHVGIRFDRSLLSPTFNSMRIEPNSSFWSRPQTGIAGDRTRVQYGSQLEPEERSFIERKCLSTYRNIISLCLRPLD
jgi:hypothetical protein